MSYSEVNGMQMYYEVYPDLASDCLLELSPWGSNSSGHAGKGKPLVLIHGGGSTIQTSFGRVIPLFSKGRQLICVELQAHGRTGDRDCGISFEQDADDVV